MSAGEWSIEHDEHDRQRLQTERELAGRLPSPDYSIELPRHIPLDAFDDVSERSSMQFQFQARHRALDSYRDGEDTHGGEGQTVSTAAHHASALTLSAGLAPRFGSPDGLEFDAQRPLDDMGIPADISLFNITRTPRSARSDARAHPHPHPIRPAVLDPGAQLDSVARSGRFRSHPRETDDAVSDVSTAARRSDVDPGPQSPRLADALNRHAFSPKRPRAQPLYHPEPVTVMPAMTSTPSYPRPPHAQQQQQQQQQQQRVASGASKTASTPTARDDSTQDGSRFERMAKGLSTDLAKAKQDVLLAQHKARQRAPFSDIGNAPPSATPARPTHRRTQTPARMSVKGSRVHLPDVTGITAAVASPARAGASYYDADEELSQFDHLPVGMPNGQAVSDAIEELAARLADLETENGAARRRVRELEHELDACRAEVARERTRVLDAEARERKDRDRMRTSAANAASDRIWESRYKEAVDEKKSLETLVSQLRTQLARMTRELESHQAALHELRTLRDSDAAQMRAKIAEIEELRDEVDRLSDEVERLRDVIEDGLERRREKSMVGQSHHSQSLISPPVSEDGGEEYAPEPEPQGLSAVPEEPSQELRAEESYRDRQRPQSRISQIREVSHDNDWFHRTDGATAGSERPPRFLEPEEVSRIESELDERRTERSIRGEGTGRYRSFRETHSLPSSRAQSPALTERPPIAKASSVPAPSAPAQAANPVRSKRQRTQMPAEADVTMRGERLQKMFSNAPEHNEHTCAVCHRRKRSGGARFHSAPPDVPAQWAPPGQDVDDEGFAEAEAVEQDRLPPQTVLTRVLRELEDDFTHYKGLYVDLADQYKLMDAASNVVKRNVVAEQLKEVIETLEQKGDHIAALYDLLKFGDKPLLAEKGWTTSNGRMRACRP